MFEKTIRLPFRDDSPTATLMYGQDVVESLKGLPENYIHTVVTSPPYWGLRSYLDSDDPLKSQEIGGESEMDAFIESIREVFRQLRRVLRPDGTVWLNLGDSFAGGGRAGKNPEYWERHTSFGRGDTVTRAGGMGMPLPIPDGLKPKDMMGIPWKVAFALQADGWYLRAACPWIKRTVMPESCTDRPSSAVEYVFLLAHPDSHGKYYYDIYGARAPLAQGSITRLSQATFDSQTGGAKDYGATGQNTNRSARRSVANLKAKLDAGVATRQRRAADWFMESIEDIIAGEQLLLQAEDGDPLAMVVNPKPYKGSHFAVFPAKLVEPCVRLSTSAYGVCKQCGAQWQRVLGTPTPVEGHGSGNVQRKVAENGERSRTNTHLGSSVPWSPSVTPTEGWEPTCECGPDVGVEPAIVLDTFSGSATTGMVALQEGRRYLGLDLNEQYLPLAEARITGSPPPSVAAPVSVVEVDSEDNSILGMFGGGE